MMALYIHQNRRPAKAAVFLADTLHVLIVAKQHLKSLILLFGSHKEVLLTFHDAEQAAAVHKFTDTNKHKFAVYR